jgi:hypothetical protein
MTLDVRMAIIEGVAAAERIQKSRVWFEPDSDILEELVRFRQDGLKLLGYIATHQDHMERIDSENKD